MAAVTAVHAGACCGSEGSTSVRSTSCSQARARGEPALTERTESGAVDGLVDVVRVGSCDPFVRAVGVGCEMVLSSHRAWNEQRGGDTSNLMYCDTLLYQYIAMYCDVLMYCATGALTPRACEYTSKIHQFLRRRECLTCSRLLQNAPYWYQDGP